MAIFLFSFFLFFFFSFFVDHAFTHRLWSQIASNFVGPQISQLVLKDRKVAAVGLTRLLTQSTLALKEPSVKTW